MIRRLLLDLLAVAVVLAFWALLLALVFAGGTPHAAP